jgi:hypothetical protein
MNASEPTTYKHSLFAVDSLRSSEEATPENNHTFIVRKKLINILNKINFQDDSIVLSFKHPKYRSVITFRAKPQPCLDDKLSCLWDNREGFDDRIKSYEFLHFQVDNGLNRIIVETEPLYIGEDGFRCRLPDKCYEISSRKVRRHQCNNVYVQISQSGVVFYGLLTGFSAVSQSIDISMVPSSVLRKINVHSSVNIILKNDDNLIFTGDCSIIRLINENTTRILIVKSVADQIHRYRPKDCRSERQQLIPSPDLIFTHPITSQRVNLKVIDISGSGFSVEENYDNSVFLPGMKIVGASLEYANSLLLNCDLQVLYCRKENNKVKSGMVILDMDAQEHVKLMGLLLQVKNRNSYISTNNIDLDSLWNFFFETGFLYPEKYAFIEPQKERFKQVYQKLYTEPSEISRHIIYQDKGKIYGHVAMLRFYDKTWLVQHHAARLSRKNRAGILVAEQLGQYINEFHYLASANMNYLACYYRSGNRFPDRVYGGVARALNNQKASSIDLFGYFHCRKEKNPSDLQGPFELVECQPDDLTELNAFYEYFSGGLLMQALDLTPILPDYENLCGKYQQHGFKRDRSLFSLKGQNGLKAVFMVNLSNVGLNMSDLTNCIQVFVLDDNLKRNAFDAALGKLCHLYPDDEIPVVVYPSSYAETHGIECNKTYNMLVLSIDYFDHFIKHLNKLMHLEKKR